MTENGGGRFPNAGKFGQKPGDPRRPPGPQRCRRRRRQVGNARNQSPLEM